MSGAVCRTSVLIPTTGVFTLLHDVPIATNADAQIRDPSHGHWSVMSKRERIFLKILCRQNFERNSYILVVKCICIPLIQAYSCIFAYKCISQNLFGQTELILVAVTNPVISKNKFCHSLWIRKRLKKHTPFSQLMTVERRGKLRAVFVKKRD